MSNAQENSVKLRDIANVKDYGAKGNGIADDTAAISAAISAGKSAYFPAGTYNVTTVTITKYPLHGLARSALGSPAPSCGLRRTCATRR